MSAFPLKSAPSVGGVHKFRFLTHMAIIKDPKLALEMAWEVICANFIALFDWGYNPERSVKNHMFYECGHISGSKSSRDMVFRSFNVKFYE